MTPTWATEVRLDPSTPTAAYVDPDPPLKLAEKPDRLEQHEKLQLRTAAYRATRLYPGPVGDLISRELLAAEEFGYRMLNTTLVAKLCDEILKPPG